MGLLLRFVIVAVAVLAWYVSQRLNCTPSMPYINPDPWWGPGKPKPVDASIKPFVINIPVADVQDLQARLAQAPRLAPSLEGVNFTYGMDSTTMAVILKYWRDSYDWKKRETKLNAYPHFKTRIEGLDIHFMRASPPAGSGKTVRPLLLLHGWPGSFVEFMGILPLLTTPRADSEVVFDVICPSLPGYGFSEAAAKPGMSSVAIAQIMTKLMKRLGFSKFYVQGGDWGAAITLDVATVFPDNLYGMHVNMMMASSWSNQIKLFLGAFLPSGFVMDYAQEKKFYPLSELFSFVLRETGYLHIQATKPDTIGVALNSSPVGLAAYILEKFSTATNKSYVYHKNGRLLEPDFPIPLDAVLDDISLYWFTGCITSSMRLYAESFNPSSLSLKVKNIPTKVPAGVAAFANEIMVVPENLAKQKLRNIVS